MQSNRTTGQRFTYNELQANQNGNVDNQLPVNHDGNVGDAGGVDNIQDADDTGRPGRPDSVGGGRPTTGVNNGSRVNRDSNLIDRLPPSNATLKSEKLVQWGVSPEAVEELGARALLTAKINGKDVVVLDTATSEKGDNAAMAKRVYPFFSPDDSEESLVKIPAFEGISNTEAEKALSKTSDLPTILAPGVNVVSTKKVPVCVSVMGAWNPHVDGFSYDKAAFQAADDAGKRAIAQQSVKALFDHENNGTHQQTAAIVNGEAVPMETPVSYMDGSLAAEGHYKQAHIFSVDSKYILPEDASKYAADRLGCQAVSTMVSSIQGFDGTYSDVDAVGKDNVLLYAGAADVLCFLAEPDSDLYEAMGSILDQDGKFCKEREDIGDNMSTFAPMSHRGVERALTFLANHINERNAQRPEQAIALPFVNADGSIDPAKLIEARDTILDNYEAYCNGKGGAGGDQHILGFTGKNEGVKTREWTIPVDRDLLPLDEYIDQRNAGGAKIEKPIDDMGHTHMSPQWFMQSIFRAYFTEMDSTDMEFQKVFAQEAKPLLAMQMGLTFDQNPACPEQIKPIIAAVREEWGNAFDRYTEALSEEYPNEEAYLSAVIPPLAEAEVAKRLLPDAVKNIPEFQVDVLPPGITLMLTNMRRLFDQPEVQKGFGDYFRAEGNFENSTAQALFTQRYGDKALKDVAPRLLESYLQYNDDPIIVVQSDHFSSAGA